MADYPITADARRIVYTGSVGVGPYSYSFPILVDTDIAVYKNTTLLTLTTDYTVSINSTGTGNVTLVSAATGSDRITIVGARAIQRSTDFVTGGDLFANTLNTELDSEVIFVQQVAETAERSIKAPVTDPTSINMTLPANTTRANKFLSFDASGNPTTNNAVGTYKGNWATGTSYIVYDLIKDTSNNNIYLCLTAHTSTGSQPISSNADVDKWALIVDAESATTSANAAAASYDSFDDRYLGSKASAPSVDNDGNALLTGALYWDSTSSLMKVWDGSAWVDVNVSGSQSANRFLASPNGSSGVPSYRAIVAADVPTLNQNTTGSAATLTTARNIYGNSFDGSAALTGIIASTFGGTGNGFTKFSGPTTSEKTFTLPNANATILTSNTAVTTAQGGTGLTSFTSGGAVYATSTSALTTGTLPVASGGTGVTTSTGSGNNVLSTSPTLVTPALGTPSSATLTNATGLPVSTGISGLGTGVATFLATPSSSNLASAITDETGSGSLVFATSPTLVTPALGTPSSATLTNATGLPLTTGVIGTLPIANGGTNITTYTTGDIIYASATNTLSKLGIGTANQVLTVSAGGVPTWAAASGGGGSGTVTSVSVTSANGFAGTVANATTTPAITLSTSVTGLLKGNGTAISAASSGTDYAPATSGTSILYGNGSGGFSDVTIGSGLAFTSGTLSASGGGGSMVYPTGTGIAVVTSGTTWGTTLTAPTGAIVGTSDTQTLTNKTLTTPIISSISNTGTLTLPTSTDTLVGRATTDTLTNKTLTSPTLTTATTSGKFTFGGAIDETVYAVIDAAGVALSPTNGTIQTWTLGANRTPTAGTWDAGQSMTLMINDGTAYTVTWTTLGVTWVGGSAPTLATTGYTVIVLWKVGSTIYGSLIGSVA